MTWASRVAQNPPANAEEAWDEGSTPGQEDPLEKAMATHSSILTWRIPWMEEPGIRNAESWSLGPTSSFYTETEVGPSDPKPMKIKAPKP